MSSRSNIEWCDATWNPIRGCTRVSEGCRNCYAERQAVRQAGPGQAYEGLVRSTPNGPRWTGKIDLVTNNLTEPLRWRKPRRVFVNSMSDLFHEGVPDEYIDLIFAVMAIARQHSFQILTKRPERALAYLGARDRLEEIYLRWHHVSDGPREAAAWPLPNVWLGVSVEDQHAADERIPLLLRTPAAVRFLSCEPLLGPIDILQSIRILHRELGDFHPVFDTRGGIDWVIVGGESGPGARPMDVQWARSIVEQCQRAGVAVFVKQLGASPFDSVKATFDERFRKLDSRKGNDPAEWPEALRVREMPEGASV